jgi:DNA-binding MurR/RpiR family transcriptional regulator
MTKMPHIDTKTGRRRRQKPEVFLRPPCDWPELIARLRAHRVGRSASLAKIADYALEQPLEVALGKTARIAEVCDVSAPDVVRLAQKLGFEGFIEMRDFFRGPLRLSPTHTDSGVRHPTPSQ